jgi:hypothetical protein
MLHLFAPLIGLLAAPALSVCDLGKLSPVDFATQLHKSRLRDCLIEQTIFITGKPLVDKYVRVPGRGPLRFGGVRLEHHRVLSVIGVTQGFSLSMANERSLEVVELDPKTGVAILSMNLNGSTVSKSTGKITPGRVFFAIDEDKRLHRFVVSGRGQGGFGFYWRAEVRLPIGTPVFNARGQWVSLIALSAAGAGSYLLPQRAFDEIVFTKESSP